MAILIRLVATALAITAPMVLTGCATVSSQVTPSDCASGSIAVDKDFEAGAFASCERLGPSEFRLTISPEDAPPINCSPWYAFRIKTSAPNPTPVRVTLNYTACEHRYLPRRSHDGRIWSALSRDNVRAAEGNRKVATIDLDLLAPTTFVAAQEIVGSQHYAEQLARYSGVAGVRVVEFGTSKEGRPIRGMIVHSGAGLAGEQVLLIGRQHPPEVTGAIAMDSFLDAMMSDNPIAKAYRERFETYVLPLLNPDGVAKGNWRHNAGGIDLNRDWARFTQPETRAVGQLMTLFERDPNKNLRLLVDFHSTHQDLFYTIPDELETTPTFVARDWMARLATRMPEYQAERISEHNHRLPTAKTQTYVRYGIPTATFEVGDRTDRNVIRRLGYESSLALMETMTSTGQPTGLEPSRAKDGN